MEFEIGHLDMLNSSDHLPSTHRSSPSAVSGSLILNELQKETEELQSKLKLNNRRLLLFETENNKLIEEKNKTTSQINETQLAELKRFTKFHLKIQNVIKPYIQQLKSRNESLVHELQSAKAQVSQLNTQNSQLEQRLRDENEFFSHKTNSMEMDKNQIITCYEEQIHSFSNEINRLQQSNEDYHKEIGRLKKAVEFKNYYENELIKFKRVHEDDQREMMVLSEKLNTISVKLTEKEHTESVQLDQHKSIESNLHSVQHVLESTRQQLLKQIDHAALLTERLARLEKLNLSLSQQMQPTI